MILWKGWMANTMVKFVFSAIGIFLISLLYEGLKYFREIIYLKSTGKRSCRDCKNCNSTESEMPLADTTEKRLVDYLTDNYHLIQTFLHLLQITVSYILMLIAMTFNLWLLLAIVLGAACGYYCFGWIRSRNSDITEHCH
jgi:copper transporter 1